MLDGMTVPPSWSTSLRTRPFRIGSDGVDRDDVSVATRLMAACDVAVLGETDAGEGEVERMLASTGTDHEASFLALVDGEPVGFVWVERDDTGAETYVDLFAPPGPAARAVLDLGLERALSAARTHRDASGGAAGWTLRSGCYAEDAPLVSALVAHGLVLERHFFKMRIDASSPLVPATVPPLPEGVEIVVRDDDATRRRVHAVTEEAFAEHWNHVPRPYDEWWEYVRARPSRDPEGWWLLTVDGEDAAVALLDDRLADVGDGYVAVLGVLPAFRGRGLGRLLLQRAFVRDRDRGRVGTQLGVDAGNTTGAVRLYESVGMSPVRVVQSYARRLDADPGTG